MGLIAPKSAVNSAIGVAEKEMICCREGKNRIVRKPRPILKNVTTLELKVVPLVGRACNVTDDCSKHDIYSAIEVGTPVVRRPPR